MRPWRRTGGRPPTASPRPPRARRPRRRCGGETPPGGARLAPPRGARARAGGAPAEALARFQRALAIREGRLGPDNLRVAPPLEGMGAVLLALGRRREALAALDRAAAIRARAGGDAHSLAGL